MNQSLIDKVSANLESLNQLSAEDLLKELLSIMGNELVLANSLSLEDVTLTHMMHAIDPKFKAFALDTGRLNPETYMVMDRIQEKYSLDLEILFPNNDAVESMVKEKGINLFYESIENRKQCCQVRKVEPLNRVLSKYSGWVCGLRQEQSPTRDQVAKVEIDSAHGGMLKINPLADWTLSQVKDYVKAGSIPYNKLYDNGYQSIGCAPCTRAVKDGESERAGRWSWENPDSKECGLHGK